LSHSFARYERTFGFSRLFLVGFAKARSGFEGGVQVDQETNRIKT
jgi:hypothetical protein